MKTILHLIDTTGPGGAETVFIQLADLLRNRGYRSVVVIRGKGWVYDELLRRGLSPTILNAKGSFALGFLFELVRLVFKEKIDLIQSHLLGSNVYAALIGIITRKPVIATYHGMVDVNPNERFRTAKLKVMQWGISRYVAVSQRLKENIQNQKLLDPGKTSVIYNGVDTKKYGRNNTCEIRRQLQIPEGALLVGSLGNVRSAKAYDILIQAALHVVVKRPDIHFIIAGHQKLSLMENLNELMDELKVRNSVHFIGFQNDCAGFLGQMDFFVLSSKSEGFSIATIEAMASGLPVLVTRCGGPEEIVTHGETGWMIDPGNPESLAQELLRLISDPSLCRELSKAGQGHVRSTFSMSIMLKAYEEIYRALLQF